MEAVSALPDPIILTWDEVEAAALVGVKRYIEALRLGRKQRWGDLAGAAWENHIVGALGESAFSKFTGISWTPGNRLDVKSSADVGTLWQVRCTRGLSSPLLVYDYDLKKPPWTPLALVTYEEDHSLFGGERVMAFQVPGFIYLSETKEVGVFGVKVEGRATPLRKPAWVIRQADLHLVPRGARP